MASLILVRNVVGELRSKRTLAASRGFLAAARLSCFEIFLLKDRKLLILPTPPHCLSPPLGVTPFEFCDEIW